MDGMQYGGGGLAFLIYIIFKLIEENGIGGAGSVIFTIFKFIIKIYCYVFSGLGLIFGIMFFLHYIGFPKEWGGLLFTISVATGGYIAIAFEAYLDKRKH